MVATSETRNKKREVIQGLFDRSFKLSHSAFNQFCNSPKHFIEYKTQERKQTPAMKFGSVVHCLVLEPEEFKNRYVVSDLSEPSTEAGQTFCKAMIEGLDEITAFQLAGYKPGKDLSASAVRTYEKYSEYIDFIKSLNGRELVTKSDFDLAERMKKAVWENDASGWILEQITHTEIKAQWNWNGWDWHGFIDGKGDKIMMDLKTVADATPRKVERDIKQKRYHYQAAHYTRGAGFKDHEYYIIAVDKGCNVSVFHLHENMLNATWEEMDYRMNMFKRCLGLNEWEKSYDFWANAGIYHI